MRTFTYVACSLIVLAFVVVGCTKKDDVSASPVATAAILQKTCPVTGNPINKDIFVDYNGQRIYFCCNLCPATFNKDPEKYVKIVNDQIAGAKDKTPATPPETK